MKKYQACYGKPDNRNWMLFNFSEDIPQEAKSLYEKAVNTHTPGYMKNEDMIDSNGAPLCILEIVSDNGYTVVSRTKYGSKDSFGRATMFSHGYIFESEDIMSSPIFIPAISDSNFRFDVESTKNIPESLIVEKNFSLEESMDICGLNLNKINELMKVIYITINSPSNYPIYLVSENKDKIFKHLILCIYSFLPKAMRSMIAFSDANIFSTAGFKNFMVVDKKVSTGFFFDLSTGETNVDDDDFVAFPEKYQPLRRMESFADADDYISYLTNLEKTLESYFPHSKVDYDSIRFCDARLFWKNDTNEVPQEQFDYYLFDLLSYCKWNSKDIDDVIAEILEAYSKVYENMNDALFDKMDARVAVTESQELRNVYRELGIKKILSCGDEGVVDFLRKKRGAGFQELVKGVELIKGYPQGTSGTNEYFKREIEKATTKEKLRNLAEECKTIGIQEDIFYRIDQRELELFQRNLGLPSHIFDTGEDFIKQLSTLAEHVKYRREMADNLKDILERFSSARKNNLITEGDACQISRALQIYSFERKEDIEKYVDISYWIETANLCVDALHSNPCKLLYDWEIDAIVEPKAFYEAILELCDEEQIKNIINNFDADDNSFVERLGTKSDEYKLWKKNINNLRNYIKKCEKKNKHSGDEEWGESNKADENDDKKQSIFSKMTSKLKVKK